jgi:hypothetical protein
VLALLLWLAIVRPYHPVTIEQVHETRHTHIEVVGTVTLVEHEGDGDVHFRVADQQGRWIVCEIVPYHRLRPPVKGEVLIVRWIHRYDNEVGHGWDEIHPVEAIEVVSGRAGSH